ncbi:hypothetical protein SAMN02745248_02013 [Hathewaya proteolytica DSM 3090]|uniref:Uncharacterized protein n=1 Tax=Hathewaya proteolytica DSM 3090 TaxID=1121331 RepID=A0A1M6QIA9_9CLOT|nr:hypothetical protein [Hathewaya proteolytica]SHK20054.1 hypothetical protein SAMN02745248_02013 [Hathewaya proteolytica DSM 3090]
MNLRKFKNVICFVIMGCIIFSNAIYVSAADRICWNKKMTGGASIFYWVSSDVIYASNIRNAEIEIEIPAAGYKNPMKMTKTTEKKQSQMDFYQYSDANSSTIAATYSYLAGSQTPMYVSDKDNYDWQWCKIELNKPLMNQRTPAGRTVTCVHEMLHAFGGKDTYSSDQTWSIMYGLSSGTATGVTSDANAFLNEKY